MRTDTNQTFRITRRHILRQLKYDLIGKDSQRGVTFTYSWMANQFGHFGLGFIPTILVYILLPTMAYAHIWAAVMVAGFWVVFETYNVLAPLLKFKSTQRIKLNYKKGLTFNPAWGNIIYDTCTDLLFFSLGAFAASLTVMPSTIGWIIEGVLVVGLIFPCHYWYTTKLYLQTAQYPYQLRLSQWGYWLDTPAKELVESFMSSPGAGRHLLVVGAEGSGKTSLSIAIATELSIKHYSCLYTTSMKLFSNFFDAAVSGDDAPLWSWRNAHVLVIDDINPGPPVREDIIGTEVFCRILDRYEPTNPENRKALKDKNVIWVVGGKSPDDTSIVPWLSMLEKIGVEKQNILPVYLSSRQ